MAIGTEHTLQKGILVNDKSFENFSYFLGGIDVTHQNLDSFTPYIRGVSRFFVHKPPQFMLSKFGDLTKQFKTYLETGYTTVDGIGDISVDFVDFEGGFAGQRFSNVSLSRDDTESITVSVYELTGSPVRDYLDLWITGVRDPRSGIAHYHGAIADGTCPYGETNHTAEFIYVTLDPTGQNAEYVCMFAHAFPTKVLSGGDLHHGGKHIVTKAVFKPFARFKNKRSLRQILHRFTGLHDSVGL